MNKQKNAFTLVELIVVITILAILWTIAFISLQWYSKDARDSIRISDISSIKTSLELFHLNSGKYPLPDDKQIVDYWTETLWYQWNFWTTVISSLSRSMSEVPTDPLTAKKYIFSVANNKNEFEILSLLEWDWIALNPLIPLSGEIATAASLVVTPKIDWTYNRVFIKTASFIVPVPSIVTSEILSWTMTLDSNNISSQVVNGWENIPEQWNVISNTWALTWLVLSVYTWSININTSNSEKEIVIGKIKDAYTASVLASSDIYEYILATSWEEEIVKVLNSIVLNNDTTEITINPDPYASCTWVNIPTPFNTTSTYDLCDIPDIVVCNWLWIWITIAWCNIWATAWSEYDLCVDWASCTTARVWWYFQFGRNTPYPTWTNGVLWNSWDWESGWWTDWWSANYWWVYEADKITTTYNNPIWATNIWLMQWLCQNDYHIPTAKEWSDLHTAWGWSVWNNVKDDLKLPMAGQRHYSDSNLAQQGTNGHYWSSSPSTNNAYELTFDSANISFTNIITRSYGFSIRCFKN